MGKTRDLFKKIRDTKGTFHAKIWHGPNRSRIHRRTVQKDLYDPDNHEGVITHLEPDIPECEVKWVLGNLQTKLVEVMKFQLSYLKS